MIYELNHLGIGVTDLNRSVDFYTRLFGAKEVWRFAPEGASSEIAYLQVAQGLIELMELAPGTFEPGANHFGFHTDDLEGDYARLVAEGATGVVPPRVPGSGVGMQAMVFDPDGVAIELLERELHVRTGVVEHPHVIAIDHVALQAADSRKSFEFYRDSLGMNVHKEFSNPDKDSLMAYLNYGEDVIELLPEGGHEGARLNHVALVVDDVDAMLEHIVANNGTPDGPARPANSGMGKVASITDPDGVVIELIDRPRILTL